MKRSTRILLKILVWIACLLPIAWLVWDAVMNNLGPDPTAAITFTTGLGTLRLIAITLAITPLRRLVPRLAWLIQFRRGQREDRLGRSLLIVLANRVQNRQRRSAQPAANAAGDFFFAAPPACQQSSTAEDLGPLVSLHRRQIHSADHLLAMGNKESFHAGEQKSDTFSSIGKGKPSRRQSTTPPALNGFA